MVLRINLFEGFVNGYFDIFSKKFWWEDWGSNPEPTP
jgi:hypothetical protein